MLRQEAEFIRAEEIMNLSSSIYHKQRAKFEVEEDCLFNFIISVVDGDGL